MKPSLISGVHGSVFSGKRICPLIGSGETCYTEAPGLTGFS